MSSEDRLKRLGLEKYKDDPKKLKEKLDALIKEREQQERDWNEKTKRDAEDDQR